MPRLHRMPLTYASVAPGEVSSRRPVPATIARPEYVDRPAPAKYTGPEVKDAETIEKMRIAGRIAAQAMAAAAAAIAPGVTTDEIDRVGHEFLLDHGAYPSTLGYRSFPKSLCTSVNEVICHGIPSDDKILREGDIINIDITTILDGYFGDTSEMFAVGQISKEAQQLIDITRQSMWLGILEVAPNKRIGDIGAAIVDFASGQHRMGVVEAFCGHGIGREFHMAPQIPHVGKRGNGMRVRPGMTFTIEPMINQGTPHCTILDDNWTAITRDGKLSAQVEHTILVTDDGYEVLTLRESAWRPSDARV